MGSRPQTGVPSTVLVYDMHLINIDLIHECITRIRYFIAALSEVGISNGAVAS